MGCPECHTTLTPSLSVPPLGLYSMADAEGKADILRRRSVAHTKREVNKEPERFGMKQTEKFREDKIFSSGGLGKK